LLFGFCFSIHRCFLFLELLSNAPELFFVSHFLLNFGFLFLQLFTPRSSSSWASMAWFAWTTSAIRLRISPNKVSFLIHEFQNGEGRACDSGAVRVEHDQSKILITFSWLCFLVVVFCELHRHFWFFFISLSPCLTHRHRASRVVFHRRHPAASAYRQIFSWTCLYHTR
jgi:hypothetical protein